MEISKTDLWSFEGLRTGSECCHIECRVFGQAFEQGQLKVFVKFVHLYSLLFLLCYTVSFISCLWKFLCKLAPLFHSPSFPPFWFKPKFPEFALCNNCLERFSKFPLMPCCALFVTLAVLYSHFSLYF